MPTILQTFGLSVTLKKLVDRANSYAGAAAARQKAIDLTHYMGENDSIRTVKALNQPAGGLTITFADQLSFELQDTIYALIEPMDMIEIRAARLPQDYAGEPLPLIMRGFVSSVQRSEQIGGDGTPQRSVVVRGIDAGKLWQINQVLFEFLQASGQEFLSQFSMLAAIGLDGGLMPVQEYMQLLVNYMNIQVGSLAAYSNQMVPKFTLDCSVTQGQAFMQAIATMQGSIWDYAEFFADRPWNELYIIDQEDGPHVIFRPVPYTDLAGKLIMAGAATPPIVKIRAVELLSVDVSRSDLRVANYFWVPPSDGTLDTGAFLTAQAIAVGLPALGDHANNSLTLYGQKIMRQKSSLYSSEAPAVIPAKLPESKQQSANYDYLAWNLQRAADLRSMNQDNSVLEEGTMEVNGREQYQIGTLVQLTRGTLVSTAYCRQVSHVISPFRSWTTTLSVERGTGFYVRDQASDVPFFAEGRSGAYP